MKFVLIHLKERLSQKELGEAEGRARACGMSLDEWLVAMLKGAIRDPKSLPPIEEIFKKQLREPASRE